MNETKDLIIGIDFGKEYSQICYYDRKADEPRSLPVKVGSSQFEMPTSLCRRLEQRDYCVGLEAEYFAREKGGFLISDLYAVSKSRERIIVADVEKNIRALVISMETLDSVQVDNLQKACGFLGLPKEYCILQDYEESFYYYVMTQKIETWNRSVGWYSFRDRHVTFRRMVLNAGNKPVPVMLETPVETDLSEDMEQRDADFYAFVQNTLSKELYSSIQINGDGFDQEWAKKSVKLLCYQKRKVFYGNNLFARGACAAGAERLITHRLRDYRYMSRSLVLTSVGMEMRVMGAPTYYPLIEAGRNWYESSADIELILDDTDELVFVVEHMRESERRHIVMKLPGLPQRPNRTTRLSISLRYISAEECCITVKDLGFGEMFPASGKEWKETTRWQEGIA